MKFLSVHVEQHDAFWFLFKPKLVKFIDKITVELVEVLQGWHARDKVVEVGLERVTLEQAIGHLREIDPNQTVDDLNGKESDELLWCNFH